MYARADLSNNTLRTLAKLQKPDIILDGKESSVGSVSSKTMRAETISRNIPSVTIEYGNPQVFQEEMTDRGFQGILNTLGWLNMYGKIDLEGFEDIAVYCNRSYWIYMEEGGFLEINVKLNQKLLKGDKIAIVRNAFGEIIKEYIAPEDGIVIGKSSNPENMSGGRIIHLGVSVK
jgi:predicted deacylase